MVMTVMLPDPKRVYQFGPFRLDIGQRTLTRGGEALSLTHKAFDTLALLVQNSGRVLQKDEMMKSIWPGTFVEEATLAQNVFILRRLLGETPTETRYIETVPRQGYRFIAKVREVLPSYAELPGDDSKSLIKSLAVLPFKLLTGEPGNEYFGVGMADALVTRLSNISDIIVRPSSSVLKYNRPDVDLCAAGYELKVHLILDGMIQRLDDRIRVTVQLVNAENGVPLWADKFDEKFSDVFTIQDIISERVVDALTLRLTKAQRLLLTKRYTENPEAYRNYLRGRYLWSKWTEEAFRKSIHFFEYAVSIQPDYALAYAGLADAYVSLCFYGHERSHEAMQKAKTMARRALQLDEHLAEARLPLAAALFLYDWDWAGAEAEFERTVEDNPGYAVAQQCYGLYLLALGRFDEALLRMKCALEVDPISPFIKTTAAFPYYYSGQYEEAAKLYLETLEEDPGFGLAHVALADVYVQTGQYDLAIKYYEQGLSRWGAKLVLPYLGYAYAVSNRREQALSALNELQRMSEREYVSPFLLAVVLAGLGDDDELFATLNQAYVERSNRLVFLAVQPIFNRLHGDERFVDLLRRIGLTALV